MGISLDEADRGEADVVTTRGKRGGKPPGLSDILSRGSFAIFHRGKGLIAFNKVWLEGGKTRSLQRGRR